MIARPLDLWTHREPVVTLQPDFGPGPMQAVVDVLTHHDEFTVDAVGERFVMTKNPPGFLRRIRS